MAQTGYTPISLYYSTTASAAPTAGNLVAGELAINTLDGKLFYKDSAGVVQTLASKGTGTIGGSTTQVQYNNAGAFAGSANMTFNGTNLTLLNALGIGAAPPTNTALALSYAPTSGVNNQGILVNYTIQSNATISGSYFSSGAATAAAAFTLPTLRHFYANQGTIGATSTVTNQYGFLVENTLTGATNDYGFYGGLAAATGVYNLYMAGTANNYLAGNLGIGITTNITPSAATVNGINIGGNTNATTNHIGVTNELVATSTLTSSLRGFISNLGTAAAAFTLPSIQHFRALQAGIGAGSTVTNQYGYFADGTLVGATNNYGFYGNIPAGTGDYNLYMAGTADNYLAGSLGIGGIASVTDNLGVYKPLTGGINGFEIAANYSVLSDVTAGANTFTSYPTTQATAFTCAELRHFYAWGRTFGAGSTVTNQYGFFVASSTTSATNNYGFHGNLAAATGRWNLYMSGTAANYFGGDMQFNKTVTAGGTTGAQTISKNAGTVNFAAAATSLVVTNTLVTTSSIIICTVGTNDTTMKSASAVAAAGSFTIFSNAAATAETRVNFIVIN
jgi:hypothetical protein